MSKDKSHKYFGISLSEITKREGSVIPNIIWKLTNYLLKNGLEEEGIFRINGSTKTVEKLINQFDKKGDADLSNVNDPASIASLLKQYLRDLPDTLIPANMTKSFITAQEACLKDGKNSVSDLRQLVSTLPVENFQTLKYLMAFLVLASNHHSYSKMNENALSTVFGPNVFKCGPGFAGLKEQGVTNCIVLQFITKYHQIFSRAEDEMTPKDEQFTLDRLRELLKKEKIRMLDVDYTNGAKASKDQNLSASVRSQSEDRKMNDKGDGLKGSLSGNFGSKTSRSDEADSADNKYLKTTTAEKLIEGGHIAPIGMNSRRRGSLDCSESIVISEILLSEIDEVVKKYVFSDCPSIDKESKIFAIGSNMGSLEVQPDSTTARNVNNSSTARQKVVASKNVASNSEDGVVVEEENIYREEDGDDDSTIDFSEEEEEDDIVDDDDDDGVNELLQRKAVVQHPLVRKEFDKRITDTDELIALNRRSDRNHNQQPSATAVHFKKTEDEVEISFHSESDSSHKSKYLKKKIKIVVQRIKEMEEEFENNFGRKISSNDLQYSQVKNLKKELEKYKSQLDEQQQEDFETGDDDKQHKRHHHHHHHRPQQQQPPTVSVKETFDSLMENLHVRRISAGRPEDPKLMSSQQLLEEKTSLQKALLKFEQLHGRPNTSTTKGIMMPLYDRYRVVKRFLGQSQKSDTASDDHHHQYHNHRPSSGSRNEFKDESTNYNQMTLPQLNSELQKIRQQKKTLQLELQRFELKFRQENGRRVQKVDQMAKAAEYRQYVSLKSKLKLLEVLTEKRRKLLDEVS